MKRNASTEGGSHDNRILRGTRGPARLNLYVETNSCFNSYALYKDGSYAGQRARDSVIGISTQNPPLTGPAKKLWGEVP
jgi:hypothetical protein